MTNKEKAQVLRLLMKQQNKCFICPEHIHEYKYGTQRAHRHSNSKVNIAKYGIEKVNSDENIVMVCSLECNHKAALGESSTLQKDDFFKKISTEDIDPGYHEIVNNNFWNLF